VLYSLTGLGHHHLARTHEFESRESPTCQSSGNRCFCDMVAHYQPDTCSSYDYSRNYSNKAQHRSTSNKTLPATLKIAGLADRVPTHRGGIDQEEHSEQSQWYSSAGPTKFLLSTLYEFQRARVCVSEKPIYAEATLRLKTPQWPVLIDKYVPL
jgi:hypothetical protein